ncbi:hypothetical protein [Comamonas antarctica]|uniref:hypothetical protein n=1 Tax=Comamonas antarctica TaxID=2743470 RepID=UPI0028E935B4|nr:hypothetical protein [Comamonas antarctica]
MTRTAPARLRYALARPPWAVGAGLVALAAMGAAGLLLWALHGAGPGPWPALLGLALWLAAGGSAWWRWRHWLGGWLEWDGLEWWLHAGLAGGPVLLRAAPEVCWDGQGFLLLRIAPGSGRPHWLWLQGTSAPVLWGDLRRAVYWRARPAASA